MQERAKQLLPKGERVFWPDDSHWSPAGMAVAAEQVAQTLGSELRAPAKP